MAPVKLNDRFFFIGILTLGYAMSLVKNIQKALGHYLYNVFCF
jgi:hypothetical protein